ncbi:MAG TPA: Calx-beta domain-containing protein, partial [Vicinamibacterales bacterium]|nr:Calx-beta domain-containing protein [Vicinamibacterales bacterium]
LEIGGVEWEFTGLEAIETSAEDNFEESPRLEPEVCEAGSPNPDAGTLQFEASTFTVDEFEGAVQTVAVTRTGGSTGAISATFTTSDGTATAGSDYQALNTTVFFADGQSGVQIVPIPVTPDLLAELDETVNMTLSEPGGCGALGARTTAVMTILDNRVNTPNQPSGLDTTFDTDGKVTTNFGGNDTGMAIQSDGKIVMVGGSVSDFVMARYNTNGSLDTSFGTNGLVTHNMLTGTAEEIARAVAIQSDGKIIVAGHTGQFGRPGRPAGNRFDHAVVRYNANGSVDTTFGAGGVASALIGRIFAMVLQPDGGIIVVGDAPQPEDMMVARYNPNGNLDLTFGEGGFRLFDFDLTAELAESVAVQSNGSIVLSGPHTKVGETVREQHTAVIRLDAGGDPDDTFGTDGAVILDNSRVSDGVAIQSDGRIILVGDTDGASANAPRFATMRLNTNGTPDDSFGTGGIAVTDITTRGDTARSVALQADGKIVVAGSSNNQVNPNFAAVRYNTNGTPDASFATASILSVDFFGFTDSAENVAIQGDGKIVLGGLARNAVDGYGLARVNP